MQGFEFLSGIGKPKNKNKKPQIIADNLQKISKYLDECDILSLKLTCRPFYYYFVTAQLWIGLKLNVAQEKLEYLQDLQFEQTETKQITKKDKNIRIHSLKKQNQQRINKLPKRESSNIKQKAKNINQHNQLLFRNTEIGFKRLMKTTTSKKKIGDFQYQIKEVADLPKINNVAEFVIRINDPWSTNMAKAQNIINLFKKVNQFHHKFLSQLKLPSKQFSQLLTKFLKSQEKSKIYVQATLNEPYSSLITSTQGCKQNLLIDEQLNKVCRLFWNYHQSMVKIAAQMTLFRQNIQKQKTRIEGIGINNKKKVSVQFVQNLSNLDQSVQIFVGMAENNKQLGHIVVPQIINLYYGLIEQFQQKIIIFEDTEQQVKLQQFSWGTIVKRPYFSQTIFQILASITSKIVKLATTICADDITLSITINKLKSIKGVGQSLLNIAKYFGKLKKQLEEKEKKGKDSKISECIKQFLQFYQHKDDECLFLVKNSSKLQKIVAQFKQNISNLKSQLQNNQQ